MQTGREIKLYIPFMNISTKRVKRRYFFSYLRKCVPNLIRLRHICNRLVRCSTLSFSLECFCCFCLFVCLPYRVLPSPLCSKNSIHCHWQQCLIHNRFLELTWAKCSVRILKFVASERNPITGLYFTRFKRSHISYPRDHFINKILKEVVQKATHQRQLCHSIRIHYDEPPKQILLDIDATKTKNLLVLWLTTWRQASNTEQLIVPSIEQVT